MGMTCTWTPDATVLTDAWNALDKPIQDRALMLATSTLQALTNNRVGTCPITVRPCPETRRCACAWLPHQGSDGFWYNGCDHDTSCSPLSEVDLDGPVGYIDSIKVDGQAIALDGFRLDNGHLLVWQGDGPSPLPAYQNLNLPDSRPGTWSITYSRSYPVSAEGSIAVAYLAMEYGKALTPKGKCSLPRGVTNVVRNGVTFTVDAGLFVNGLTGIEPVDSFITKWAPLGSPTRTATVFDPRKRALRRTSTLPQRPLSGTN